MKYSTENSEFSTPLTTYPGVRLSSDVFKANTPPYSKICAVCSQPFEAMRLNKNICSWACKQEHNRQHSRAIARIKRSVKKGAVVKEGCAICGFSETVDRHREGTIVVVLCPNHHCLITRGIRTLEQMLKEIQ